MTTVYYKDSNNGVTAVVTEEVYKKLEERQKLRIECHNSGLPDPQLPPIRPVFTFSGPDHHSFGFMTGSYTLMKRLLAGHDVRDGGIYVPFSNGVELGSCGQESGRFERGFMTSLDEAIEAFGLIPTAEPERYAVQIG